MVKTIEEVRENLSGECVDSLITKLKDTEFEFCGLIISREKMTRSERVGYINIKNPKADHPKSNYYPLQIGFLPVGFIGGTDKEGFYSKLINTDRKFPVDYHSQLREIYSSV